MDLKGILVAIVAVALMAGTLCGDDARPVDREGIVQAMLERSRLLEDIQFTIPADLWTHYLRDMLEPETAAAPAPTDLIIAEGRYELTVDEAKRAMLTATVRLHAFRPQACRAMAVLDAKVTWDSVTINGEPVTLAVVDDWLRFSPETPGEYVIKATAPARLVYKEAVVAQVRAVRSVQTRAVFHAAGLWEAFVTGDGRLITGETAAGTHGSLALTATDLVELRLRRPRPKAERPARYQINGDIAWNLDAGRQQIAAQLRVAIIGGTTDRIRLQIPAAAEKVTVTGPDVRDTQRSGGTITVFLRGKIAERTRVNLSYDLPSSPNQARLSPIGIADGRWAGGTLAVTNTTESSEVISDVASGLQEIDISELSESARSRLAGPAAMAYRITSRQWSVGVDVIDLGEFALRESIADLAHYTLLLRGDGSVLCLSNYEIRNRTQQFLQIRLPAGATPMLATVNEQPAPLTPTGEPDVYRLALIRSTASVEGLVSFPVEVVAHFRVAALDGAAETALTLPRIDLPIAYAWCEAYLPNGLAVKKMTGPLRRVDRYSSEAATAHMGYGRGYTEGDGDAEEETTEGGAGSSLSLGMNYYRAGQAFYAEGKYDQAAEALRRTQTLIADTPVLTNASRLLGNIEVAQGRRQVRGRAAKAAARQVGQEMALQTQALDMKQQRLAEEGLTAARTGQTKKARILLQAVDALELQRTLRGGRRKANIAAAQEELARLQPPTARVPVLGDTPVIGALTQPSKPPTAQIQLGANIAMQRGEAMMESRDRSDLYLRGPTISLPKIATAPTGEPANAQLDDFIASNYNWSAPDVDGDEAAGAAVVDRETLARRLRRNFGQKVTVVSTNLNASAGDAVSLGATFRPTKKGTQVATIDEAQFRTLREMDSRRGGGSGGGSGGAYWGRLRRQDTIVGTDAMLANNETVQVGYAADTYNDLSFDGATVNLPHEQYLLVDNNGSLTVVRAGEMQHWTDTTDTVELAEAPQTLDIPRIGQLIKLEKTLVSPTDELVLRIHYTPKGSQP